MKKILVLIVLTLIGCVAFGQNEYVIKYESDLSYKEVVEILSISKESYNRFSIDSNTIVLSYRELLSDDYFYSSESDDLDILSIISYKVMKPFLVDKAGGNNCDQAQLLCNSQALSANSGGYGVQELNYTNQGCLSGENQSSWYYINIQSGGSLTMIINPNTNSNDYDFAIWGPFTDITANANCPPINSPLRCSWAAGGGNTGLNTTASDNSEGASGNKWVSSINTSANQIYILLIDNWSTSNSGYNLSWGGSSTLGCVPVTLPIELIDFNGYSNNEQNILEWSTGSELNNDFFTIEESIDGIEWKDIFEIKGKGNSTTKNSYKQIVLNYNLGINYYRLNQTDFNGNNMGLGVVSIDNREAKRYIIKTTNMIGQDVDPKSKGFIIQTYNDGSVRKTFIE